MKRDRFFRYVLLIFFLFLLVLAAGCGGSASPVPASPSPETAAATNTAAPPRATSTRSAPTLTASPAPSPRPSPTLSPQQWFLRMSRNWRVAYYDGQEVQICAMYADGRNQLCLNFNYRDFPNSYPTSGFLAWSPDGSRLAIATECNIFIWKVGGETTPLRDGKTCGIFQNVEWSPDGSFIAYTSQELYRSSPSGQVYLPDVFVDSLDGTVHRPLTTDFTDLEWGNNYPDWSPDGRRIAFTAKGGIIVFSLDTNQAIHLTQSTGGGNPAWSPDGQFIAYTRRHEGNVDLYVMQSDDSGSRKVAQLGSEPTSYTPPYLIIWLPDGKHILYNDKLIDTRTGEIASLQFNFDTSYAEWLIPAEKAIIIPLPVPTLSPPTATPGRPRDRTSGRIAYTSCSSAELESCEIFVINADGSEPTRITQNDAEDHSPDWSPDGQRLVFVSNRDGRDEIYVMDADSGNPVRLTDAATAATSPLPGGAYSPAWSPDGKKITFVSCAELVKSNTDRFSLVSLIYGVSPPCGAIYVMNADGSDQTRLTQNEAVAKMPIWSPDGRKIYFISDRDSNDVYREIYAMDADGGNLALLTTIQFEIDSWTWSPDGTKIAVGLSGQIYKKDAVPLDPLAGKSTTLTFLPGSAHSPAWSPDSEEIVYVSKYHDSWQIFVMKADGSNPIALTGDSSMKSSPAWGPAVVARPDCTSDWTRLEAGGMAKVSEENTTPNRVRSGPSTADEIIAQLPPGTVVRLIEGPVCAGGLFFWKVESDLIPGGVGWTAEGDGTEYYLVPYNP